MKIAIISDVHSNLQALQAVFERCQIEKVVHILCLGDIIGYGGRPNECVSLVRQRLTKIVRGNHEDLLLKIDSWTSREISRMSHISLKITKDMLSANNLAWLSALNLTAKSDDGLISMIHGSFDSPWNYILNSIDALRAMNFLKTQLGFVGHSHIPFVFLGKQFFSGDEVINKIFNIDLRFEKFLANPGSVGQPRDSDNRASFGLLEINKEKAQANFQIIRVYYDIKMAAEDILKAGMPLRNAERLFNGE